MPRDNDVTLWTAERSQRQRVSTGERVKTYLGLCSQELGGNSDVCVPVRRESQSGSLAVLAQTRGDDLGALAAHTESPIKTRGFSFSSAAG